MKIDSEIILDKKISWGSVIGGVITVWAVLLLLSALGASLGFSIIEPTSNAPIDEAGIILAVWSAISIIVSLAVGAFIAGRLAANDGLIHGFLVWATSLTIAAILGTLLVGSAVKMTANALSSIASTSGTLLSDAGSSLENTTTGITNIGKNLFDQLNIDTKLEPEKLKSDVITALKKSDIPSLQPEFMQQQLDAAKTDLSDAIEAFFNESDNNDVIMQKLISNLKKRTEAITQDINQDSLKKSLSENTDMTPAEVDKTVSNLIKAKEKSAQVVKQRFDEVEVKINEAKQKYIQLKQKAHEEAARAADALAHAGLWSFVALLLGAIISALAGLWGVKTNVRHIRS